MWIGFQIILAEVSFASWDAIAFAVDLCYYWSTQLGSNFMFDCKLSQTYCIRLVTSWFQCRLLSLRPDQPNENSTLTSGVRATFRCGQIRCSFGCPHDTVSGWSWAPSRVAVLAISSASRPSESFPDPTKTNNLILPSRLPSSPGTSDVFTSVFHSNHQ